MPINAGINNNYYWLAERNGIPIITIDSNNIATLNSQAMSLLGIDANHISLPELVEIAQNPSKFKSYLNNLGKNTATFSLELLQAGIRKTLHVAGLKQDNDEKYLTFQILNANHNAAEFLCQYATNTDDVFIVVSAAEELDYISGNFENLFERDRKLLNDTVSSIQEWVKKRDVPILEEVLMLKEGTGKRLIEFRVVTPTQKVKWISLAKKVLYQGDGAAYRHMYVFSDVTARKSIEAELIESELNYRQIYNATNDAIFIHNAENGKIEDVNNAMLEMYGLSYEEALSKTIPELSSDNEAFTSEESLAAIRRSLKEPQVFEWEARHSSGKLFWVEVSLKRAEIHGKVKVIAVSRNITDRKKAESLLSENEGKYKLIVEGQNELIVRLNAEGKILFASPSFLKVLNKDEVNVLGTKFRSIALSDDHEYLNLVLDKVGSPPHTGFFEFRMETPKGERWYSWNYSGITNTINGEIDVICVGRDITYQKMVESALRESEDRFRSIVQHLSDIVFLIDENANIKYVTPSCEQYLGVGVEEMLGNNLINFIHKDDRWYAQENLTLHKEGADYSLPYEIRIKHPSNTWKVFEAKSQNMLNHPSVNGIIFTISDITERKLMEKQVLDAIIKTEEKERERFAKDLHDDLGPLLSSIKMYVGMLGKVEKKEKQEFIIKNLQEIVKEAITTTKDVSNDLNPHVLNNYGLTSALKLFIEKLSEDLNIEFIEDVGDARYSAPIELSLYRISKELINNTLKHAEATKITLKIWEKAGQLNLHYEDNGKGLPTEAFKVKKPGGMGLSNIISRTKSLNAMHTFHTNLEKGFKFEMQVPLVQE